MPALGSSAARLRLSDDALRLLVVNHLDGVPVERSPAALRDPEVFRQAGALTRLLHGSAPPRPNPAIGSRMAERPERYLRDGADLFDAREIAAGRAHAGLLAALPPTVTVPCHQDNQARNWLVDGDGTVRLIDFGLARRDVWLRDLSRMYLREWRGAAELRDAFLEAMARFPPTRNGGCCVAS